MNAERAEISLPMQGTGREDAVLEEKQHLPG